MTKLINFCIVNAYGASNRGDSVLLDECISEICEAVPDANISVAVFEGADAARAVHPNIQWTERIGNSNGGFLGRFQSIVYLIAAACSAKFGMRFVEKLLPSAQQTTLRNIADADVVVSAPGGYIHDTNFAYFIALAHIYYATALKKLVVLAPQSIGPIDGAFSRRVARRVLNRVSAICPRETYSYEFLRDDLKISSQIIHRSGDSAFWNKNICLDEVEIGKELQRLGISATDRVFGLTVVGWTFPKMENPNVAYKKYVDDISVIADYVTDQLGYKVVIFNQVTDDLATAELVRGTAKSVVVVDERDHEPPMLRALIARSEIFLGTRFHSCIFSMVAGRPTFAIAYLPKTEYIMNDLGLADRVFDIDGINVSVLLERISADHHHISSAEQLIENSVETYRISNSRLQDILKGLV